MNFKIWLEKNDSTNEYWGDFNLVTLDNNNFNITLVNDRVLKLPVKNNISKMNNFPLDQTLQPPITKYFQYNKDNQITYVENRAVDCVAYNKQNNAIYLIYRKSDPKGFALPGGFIDSDADSFNSTSPPSPEKVAAHAAIREMEEETNAKFNETDLIYLGKFNASKYDPREFKSFTWAFLVNVPTEMMKDFVAGDDAGQTAGSKELREKGLKGWYKIDELPKLVFGHHDEIVSKAMSTIQNPS